MTLFEVFLSAQIAASSVVFFATLFAFRTNFSDIYREELENGRSLDEGWKDYWLSREFNARIVTRMNRILRWRIRLLYFTLASIVFLLLLFAATISWYLSSVIENRSGTFFSNLGDGFLYSLDLLMRGFVVDFFEHFRIPRLTETELPTFSTLNIYAFFVRSFVTASAISLFIGYFNARRENKILVAFANANRESWDRETL